MNEMAIATDGLVKVYGATRAVDGLNLHVPRGAVYGFLGRNGAGKTTTIRILLGLARQTAGAVRVLGLDSRTECLEILKRTALVSERKQLYATLTPAQLVRFTQGFYPEWSRAAAEKYVRRLEIPMDKRFGKLSKGNRTKVCLLLALAQKAELLVLDEPTSGLDPVMVDQVLRALIEDQANQGRTVFFSSHQLAEVEQIADWVGIIDHGKLLLEARLEDIRRDFRMITASGNALKAMPAPNVISATQADRFWKYVLAREAESFAAQLHQQGATILENSPLSLREVFLELVRKEEPCTLGNAGMTPGTVSSSI